MMPSSPRAFPVRVRSENPLDGGLLDVAKWLHLRGMSVAWPTKTLV